jgi:hypothetical protein
VAPDPGAVCKKYRVDPFTIEKLRRSVNSVSVTESGESRTVNGTQVNMMKAVWVDGPASAGQMGTGAGAAEPGTTRTLPPLPGR